MVVFTPSAYRRDMGTHIAALEPPLLARINFDDADKPAGYGNRGAEVAHLMRAGEVDPRP
jgi:hypothetical protein